MSQKPKPILDPFNHIKTDNVAVDMCCACIKHYAVNRNPIKSIILSKAYYDIFTQWVDKNWGEEYVGADFYIEGVQIKKEWLISGKSLQVEYLNEKQPLIKS